MMNNEVHQRIAQATGMPVDTVTVDLLAREMHENLVSRVSPLDDEPNAKLLAEGIIETYHKGEPTYIGQPNGTSLYALFAFDPTIAYVLISLQDWKPLAYSQFPNNYRLCNVGSDYQCSEDNATEILAIKRGEYICIFKSCTTCKAWFGLDKEKQKWRRHHLFTVDCLSDPFPHRERIIHDSTT